jgi:hypothetical protein
MKEHFRRKKCNQGKEKNLKRKHDQKHKEHQHKNMTKATKTLEEHNQNNKRHW